jgi:hypothetical protein
MTRLNVQYFHCERCGYVGKDGPMHRPPGLPFHCAHEAKSLALSPIEVKSGPAVKRPVRRLELVT